jgi:hypothetical protein
LMARIPNRAPAPRPRPNRAPVAVQHTLAQGYPYFVGDPGGRGCGSRVVVEPCPPGRSAMRFRVRQALAVATADVLIAEQLSGRCIPESEWSEADDLRDAALRIEDEANALTAVKRWRDDLLARPEGPANPRTTTRDHRHADGGRSRA